MPAFITIASTASSLRASRTAAKPNPGELRSQEKATTTTTTNQPLSPVLLNIREDRDALSIAHDRQKYLKTLDRARNNARKAFRMEGRQRQRVVPRASSKVRGEQRLQHGAQERYTKVGGGDEDGRDAEPWLAGDEGGAATPAAAVGPGPGPVDYTAASREVRLADLVLAPHARKTRTKGRGYGRGLGGEYEFVPRVRAVVVLDDAAARTASRDMTLELDEAWECIDDDRESPQKVTYASIAAAALMNAI